MLGKLMRHEFKQTGKLLVPVFAGLLVLVLVTCILSLCGGMQAASGTSSTFVTSYGDDGNTATTMILNGDGFSGQSILSTITGIFFFITILYMVAFVMGVIIVCGMRFYKNLLGDEGYLMFTLPVSAAQQVGSKLTVAVTWTLGAVLTAMLSVIAIALSSIVRVPGLWAEFWNDFSQIGVRTEGMAGGMLAIMLLALIVGIAFMYSMLYCAMAIGSQWMQNRMLASIIAYIGISTVLQIVTMFGTLGVATAFKDQLMNWAKNLAHTTINVTQILQLMMSNIGIMCGLAALVSAIFFVITRYFLTKRLNLA